jgi:gliding motility-associated-like protein
LKRGILYSFIWAYCLIHIPFANAQTWIRKADIPGAPRFTAANFSIGHYGFVGCGVGTNNYTDFYKWNQYTNTWSSIASYPGAGSEGNFSFSANGYGYVGLGYGNGGVTNDMWRYDTATNTWSALANFPGVKRYDAHGFVIGHKAYLIAGSQGGPPYLNDVWVYDINTDTWKQLNNSPDGNADGFVVFSIGNHGYLCGGYTNPNFLTTCWQYDTTNDTWTPIASLPVPVSGEAFVVGSQAYIGDGEYTGGTWVNGYMYDTVTKAWTIFSNLAASGIQRRWTVSFAIGNFGYISTGYDNYGNSLKDLWQWGPIGFSPSEVTVLTSPSCSACNGTALINLLVPDQSLYSYLWSNGSTNNYITGLCAGKYTVAVFENSSRVYFDTVVVPASANPSVNVPATTVKNISCYNGDNGSATAIASGGTAPYSYIWFPDGQTNQTITGITAGTYTVITSDSNKCAGITTVTLTQPNLLTVNTLPEVSVEAGQSITLNATASGGTPAYTYLWDGTTPGSSIDESPRVTTSYYVLATDSNGCTATASVIVDVLCGELFVADAFSPNGDGKNDYLYVRSNCIKSMVFTIFNRWGNRVFEAGDQNTPWDGTSNGQPMNSGTYVYYLRATMNDGSVVEKKGNVTLVR